MENKIRFLSNSVFKLSFSLQATLSIHNQKQDGVEFKRLCVFRASFARDMIEVFLVCIVYDRDGLQERTEQTQKHHTQKRSCSKLYS